MLSKHIKRCHDLLTEMQIKPQWDSTTLPLKQINIFKKIKQFKGWGRQGETETLIYFPLWKRVWQFLKMLNTHLTI